MRWELAIRQFPIRKEEILCRIYRDCRNFVIFSTLIGLAPFLSKETLKKIAGYMLSHGKEKHIIAITPFMGKKIFPNIVNNTSLKTDEDVCGKSNDLDMIREE